MYIDHEENEVDSYIITDEILKLEKNSILRWGHDSFRVNRKGIYSSFLDIYIPDICDKLNLSFITSLKNPCDEDLFYHHPDSDKLKEVADYQNSLGLKYSLTEIILPSDSFIYSKKNENWFTPENSYLVEINEPLSNEMAKINFGEDYYVHQSWSYKYINKVIEQYIFILSGRKDIILNFDDTIVTPFYQEIENRGSEITYMVEEGIEITSSAFDDLLKMNPEESSAVMKFLKNLKENGDIDEK